MNTSKRQQKIDKFRGEFMGKMIQIELLFNQVLSVYISPERLNYCQFIFTKLDINVKLEIYKQIIRDKDPIFLRYTYTALLADIKEMQELRNLFAHSLAEIHFFGYKKGKAITSKSISFRNSRKMEKDLFSHVAKEYELSGHKGKLEKLDKIRNALFDVLHFYNKTIPNVNDESDNGESQ